MRDGAYQSRRPGIGNPAFSPTGPAEAGKPSGSTWTTDRRNYNAHAMRSMSTATSWYPYPTLTRREPCAAPVHCIERGSCVAAQRQCTERIVAKYGTDWSSSRGPRNGRMLAIWPMRLFAVTKCGVPSINFRSGLFQVSTNRSRYIGWFHKAIKMHFADEMFLVR